MKNGKWGLDKMRFKLLVRCSAALLIIVGIAGCESDQDGTSVPIPATIPAPPPPPPPTPEDAVDTSGLRELRTEALAEDMRQQWRPLSKVGLQILKKMSR